jgi:hypothetical protein
MQNIIVTIYTYWQKLPAGLRAGLVLLVTAVVATALAFGWTLPSNWADAKAEVAAFWLVLVPVIVAVFQKSVWPPLFAWILTLLGLAPTIDGKALITAWAPKR